MDESKLIETLESQRSYLANTTIEDTEPEFSVFFPIYDPKSITDGLINSIPGIKQAIQMITSLNFPKYVKSKSYKNFLDHLFKKFGMKMTPDMDPEYAWLIILTDYAMSKYMGPKGNIYDWHHLKTWDNTEQVEQSNLCYLLGRLMNRVDRTLGSTIEDSIDNYLGNEVIKDYYKANAPYTYEPDISFSAIPRHMLSEKLLKEFDSTMTIPFCDDYAVGMFRYSVGHNVIQNNIHRSFCLSTDIEARMASPTINPIIPGLLFLSWLYLLFKKNNLFNINDILDKIYVLSDIKPWTNIYGGMRYNIFHDDADRVERDLRLVDNCSRVRSFVRLNESFFRNLDKKESQPKLNIFPEHYLTKTLRAWRYNLPENVEQITVMSNIFGGILDDKELDPDDMMEFKDIDIVSRKDKRIAVSYFLGIDPGMPKSDKTSTFNLDPMFKVNVVEDNNNYSNRLQVRCIDNLPLSLRRDLMPSLVNDIPSARFHIVKHSLRYDGFEVLNDEDFEGLSLFVKRHMHTRFSTQGILSGLELIKDYDSVESAMKVVNEIIDSNLLSSKDGIYCSALCPHAINVNHIHRAFISKYISQYYDNVKPCNYCCGPQTLLQPAYESFGFKHIYDAYVTCANDRCMKDEAEFNNELQKSGIKLEDLKEHLDRYNFMAKAAMLLINGNLNFGRNLGIEIFNVNERFDKIRHAGRKRSKSGHSDAADADV